MDEAGPIQPTFSIITPVHNHARYVAQAIRSVIAQTYRQWEQIVVDDGSTDGSDRIAAELAGRDKRIILIRQANAGAAAARNTALGKASGQWITYLDSDDIWFPDTLASYHRYIRDHPQAKFIFGHRHRLNEDGSVTELPGEHQDRPNGTAELFQRMYISTLCVCHRRDLLQEAGTFDANLPCCEDYDLFLRMSLHCPLEPLGKPTGLRRRHEGNLSRQTGFTRMVEAEVLRRFVERHSARAALGEGIVHRRLGRLYYASARQYFKGRCFRQAIGAARLARRYEPSLKAGLVSAAARCLLPFGRSDDRELPRL
jgi:glycosyltransferase involved in cell wall biosynthesis